MSHVAQKEVNLFDFIAADQRDGNTEVKGGERKAYLKALNGVNKNVTAIEVGVGTGRFFPFLKQRLPQAEACEPNNDYALFFLESYGTDAPLHICPIEDLNPSKKFKVLVAPYTTICMFPPEHQKEFLVSMLKRGELILVDTIITGKEGGRPGKQRKVGRGGSFFWIKYFMRPKKWFIEIGEEYGFSVEFIHYVFRWRYLFGLPFLPKSINTLVVLRKK